MIDIIDKAPENYAPLVIHMTQINHQNHIFYIAYIESHYPEINIKDLLSDESNFISNGDQRLYSGHLFHICLGKIAINKEDDIHPL